jgi:hypothetical protein
VGGPSTNSSQLPKDVYICICGICVTYVCKAYVMACDVWDVCMHEYMVCCTAPAGFWFMVRGGPSGFPFISSLSFLSGDCYF